MIHKQFSSAFEQTPLDDEPARLGAPRRISRWQAPSSNGDSGIETAWSARPSRRIGNATVVQVDFASPQAARARPSSRAPLTWQTSAKGS